MQISSSSSYKLFFSCNLANYGFSFNMLSSDESNCWGLPVIFTSAFKGTKHKNVCGIKKYSMDTFQNNCTKHGMLCISTRKSLLVPKALTSHILSSHHAVAHAIGYAISPTIFKSSTTPLSSNPIGS